MSYIDDKCKKQIKKCKNKKMNKYIYLKRSVKKMKKIKFVKIGVLMISLIGGVNLFSLSASATNNLKKFIELNEAKTTNINKSNKEKSQYSNTRIINDNYNSSKKNEQKLNFDILSKHSKSINNIRKLRKNMKNFNIGVVKRTNNEEKINEIFQKMYEGNKRIEDEYNKQLEQINKEFDERKKSNSQFNNMTAMLRDNIENNFITQSDDDDSDEYFNKIAKEFKRYHGRYDMDYDDIHTEEKKYNTVLLSGKDLLLDLDEDEDKNIDDEVYIFSKENEDNVKNNNNENKLTEINKEEKEDIKKEEKENNNNDENKLTEINKEEKVLKREVNNEVDKIDNCGEINKRDVIDEPNLRLNNEDLTSCDILAIMENMKKYKDIVKILIADRNGDVEKILITDRNGDVKKIIIPGNNSENNNNNNENEFTILDKIITPNNNNNNENEFTLLNEIVTPVNTPEKVNTPENNNMNVQAPKGEVTPKSKNLIDKIRNSKKLIFNGINKFFNKVKNIVKKGVAKAKKGVVNVCKKVVTTFKKTKNC